MPAERVITKLNDFLPVEILSNIISYLPPQDVQRFISICRVMFSSFNNDSHTWNAKLSQLQPWYKLSVPQNIPLIKKEISAEQIQIYHSIEQFKQIDRIQHLVPLIPQIKSPKEINSTLRKILQKVLLLSEVSFLVSDKPLISDDYHDIIDEANALASKLADNSSSAWAVLDSMLEAINNALAYNVCKTRYTVLIDAITDTLGERKLSLTKDDFNTLLLADEKFNSWGLSYEIFQQLYSSILNMNLQNWTTNFNETFTLLSDFNKENSRFVLSKCSLTRIPKCLFTLLTRISRVDLSKNNLITLPDEIGDCQNLTLLTLENNQLISLPVTLGNLTKMKYFRADDNRLLYIPDTLSRWENVSFIYLKNNKLRSLPSTLQSFNQIEHFVVKGNQLTTFPKEYANWKLASLRIVNLEGNPLSKLPVELKAIKDVLHVGTTSDGYSIRPGKEFWEDETDRAVSAFSLR